MDYFSYIKYNIPRKYCGNNHMLFVDETNNVSNFIGGGPEYETMEKNSCLYCSQYGDAAFGNGGYGATRTG